ncbi:MAG: hypothetical protein FJ298_05700 [Planctomycetes bacterium]|nr:hypothetical protein [Planctomycetota bacterium]
MDFSLNSEPVKYALIALTVPLWLPFVRALWKELNDSLRAEGGLLGEQLSRDDLVRLDKTSGRHESPLVSETWDEHERGEARESASSRRGERASVPTRPQRRGFR